MPAPLLFVNKNAESESLTRSNASEQTSINSHVQRGRRHKRASANVGRAGGRNRKPHGRQTADADDGSIDLDVLHGTSLNPGIPASNNVITEPDGSPKSFPDRPSKQKKTIKINPPSRPVLKIRSVKVKTPSKSASALSSERTKVTVQLNSPQSSISPQDISQVTSNFLDPFGQSVVRLDPHVAKLCRYFCENFHPSVWHPSSYTYQNTAVEVVQRAMQSEVEMNAMLSCMAARIENVDMLPGQGTDKYMHNALMAVRQRFNTAPKQQLLLIVFHLYAADAYRQNYQAAKIHMQAAKALFDSWGGMDYVPDPTIKELFIIGDGHMSAVLLEPCSLPCVYDPGPYLEAVPPELQLEQGQELVHIAPTLQRLCHEGYFTQELAQVIQETVECSWVLHRPETTPPEIKKAAAKWLGWRHAAVRYRLLAMEYPGSSLEAIRIALLMWVLTSMVILGLKRLAGLIAIKLRARLCNVEEPWHEWKNLARVRSWVLTIGAMCAIAGSEDERWFVEQLFETGFAEYIRRMRQRHPHLDTLDVLKTFQLNFFYYEVHQRPRLERLASLLSGGISETPSTASQSSPSDLSRKSRSPT